MVLFLLLRHTSKAWRDLVDGSQQCAHAEFYLFKFKFQEQRILEEFFFKKLLEELDSCSSSYEFQKEPNI